MNILAILDQPALFLVGSIWMAFHALTMLLLAWFAFAVFGYVTATLATFFIGRDAADEDAEVAGAEQIRLLYEEIGALRAEVRALTSALKRQE
jgi:hypothetical protein